MRIKVKYYKSKKGTALMNKFVGKMLGNIAGSLHLYQFCAKVGIEAVFYRMCYKKELRISNAFYEQNEQRVLKNAKMFADDISKDTYLKAIKFRKTHTLKNRPNRCAENEYFNSLMKLGSNEVFIDCGAYTGDTVKAFLEKVENHYKKIVAFEPDNENFAQLSNLFNKRENCFLFKAGVWKDDGKLSFRSGELAGSRIDKNGGGGVY